MIIETRDPHSGALLFKKDKESKNLDKALKDIKDLQQRVHTLEKIIFTLLEEKA